MNLLYNLIIIVRIHYVSILFVRKIHCQTSSAFETKIYSYADSRFSFHFHNLRLACFSCKEKAISLPGKIINDILVAWIKSKRLFSCLYRYQLTFEFVLEINLILPKFFDLINPSDNIILIPNDLAVLFLLLILEP